MKTSNISILKSLVGKNIKIIELKRTTKKQSFSDGKSSAYSYERTANVFNAKIISMKGNNCSSAVMVQCNELFGDDAREFYKRVS